MSECMNMCILATMIVPLSVPIGALRTLEVKWAKKALVSICPETIACWDMGDICMVCATDAVCGPHGFQQNLTLCCIEMHTLWEIPRFTWISWQAFYTHCCNTSKSLISAEYGKVFRYSHSQKSRGLRSGSCRPVDWVSTSYALLIECLVQMLSDSAEKMRWCPIIHEPHVLLKKRYMLQEYW
jgi:hypothetical protein